MKIRTDISGILGLSKGLYKDGIRVFFLFLLILLLTGQSQCLAAAGEKIQENIKHAVTYYWFGMAEQGDLKSFHRAKHFLDEAERQLNNQVHWDQEKKSSIARQIKSLRSDVKEQIRIAFDTLYGVFPLARFLTGYLMMSPGSVQSYEIIDDPDVMAVTFAGKSLMENMIQRLKSISQHDVFFNGAPHNPTLENELFYLFGTNPIFFVHNQLELEMILSSEELENFQNNQINPTMVRTITRYLDIPRFLLVTVIESDIHDGNYFFTTQARVFQRNAESGEVLKAYGFSRDRRAGIKIALYLQAGLFLIAILIWLFLEKRTLGTGIQGLILTMLFFAIGRIFPWLVLPGLKAVSPIPETLAALSWWWCFAAGLAIFFLPLLLGIIIILKYSQLKNSDTWASLMLLTSASLGSLAYMTGPIFIYLGDFSGFIPFLLMSICIMPIPVTMARAYIISRRMQSDFSALFIYTLALMFTGFIGMAACHLEILGLLIMAACSLALMSGWFLFERRIDPAKKLITDDLDEEIRSINHAETDEIKRQVQAPAYQPPPVFQEIMTLIKRVSSGHGDELISGFAMVKGAAGTGKSRLIRELKILYKKTKEPARPIFLYGDCRGNEKSREQVPLEPFRKALKSFSGKELVSGEHYCGNHMDSFVELMVENLVGLLPGGGIAWSLLGGMASDAPKTDNELFFKISDMLFCLSKRPGTTILCIDNAQYMDTTSLRMLHFLVKEARIRKPSLTVLLFSQPTAGESDLETMAAKFNFEQFEIVADKEIAKNILLSLNLTGQTADNLIDEIFGKNQEAINIFWLLEIIRHLADQSLFKKQHNGYELSKRGSLPLSSGILEEFKTIISTLEPKEYYILECAALIGQKFEADILADALGQNRLEILNHLREIERKTGLVQDVFEEEYLFEFSSSIIVKGLKQFAACSQIIDEHGEAMPEIIREYHRMLGNSFEQNGERVFEAATHAFKAGPKLRNKARRLCMTAAQKAFDGFAYQEADKYASMGLDCVSSGQTKTTSLLIIDDEYLESVITLVCLRIDALIRLQADKQAPVKVAKKWLDILQRWPEASQYLVKIIRRLALAEYYARNNEGAIYYAKQAYEKSRESDYDRARALHVWGISLNSQNNAGQAVIKLNKAKEIIEPHAEDPLQADKQIKARRLLSEIEDSLGNALANHPDVEQRRLAVKNFQESITIKEKLYDLYGLAISYGGLGRFYLDQEEQFHKALECFTKDLKLSEKTGQHNGQMIMHSSIAGCHLKLNNPVKAVKYYQQSLVFAEACQDNTGKSFALAGIMDAAVTMNNKDKIQESSQLLQEVLPAAAPPFLKEKILNTLERVKQTDMSGEPCFDKLYERLKSTSQ